MRERLPTVSLLVAMRNEAGFIQKCLGSIFRQDYPGDLLDVWVMDGHSTDGSRKIVKRIAKDRSNLYFLDNPGITQSAGWNLGIDRSSGDILGIVSAHCELATDYVSQAVETLERTGASLVGGPMRAEGHGTVGRAVALATSTPFGVGGARFHYTKREEQVDTVYAGLCRREVYERIGKFDEEMVRNQDDELSYRLLDHGGTIICNPRIRSRYYSRTTLRHLWRQYFQYGFWKIRVMERHPRQIRFRHLAPTALVLSLVITVMAALLGGTGWTLSAIVAGAYLATNLGASLLAVRKGDHGLVWVLPLVYATLHFAYGFGAWYGILRWGVERIVGPTPSRS